MSYARSRLRVLLVCLALLPLVLSVPAASQGGGNVPPKSPVGSRTSPPSQRGYSPPANTPPHVPDL